MADYKGNTCPVCNNKFTDSDDIVVCPDCGTPYHRACWKKVGACVHSAEHAAGFEWKPDKLPEGIDDITCTNCGTHNPQGAKFCNHCGVPLPETHTEQAAPQEPGRPIYTAPTMGGGNPRTGAEPHIDAYSADASGVYRRELGPEDPIDGIKARDWASYVGRSSLYYLMQFFRMQETRRKVCISFSAFFLGPIYFFYRKMWKEGAIFTVLDLLCAVPSVLLLLALSEAPIISGMPVGWLSTALSVASILNWVQMVMRSLFAVYWYKQDSTSKIKTIYDTVPDGQARQDALALRGGVSVAAVVVYVVAYLCLSFALVSFMGPNLSAIVSALSL